MKRANIMFLHKFFTLSGGIERVHLNLASALTEQGVNPTFFVYNRSADEDGADRLAARYPVDSPSDGDRLMAKIRHLYRCIEQRQVQVIISATETANMLAWLCALRYPALKVIYTRHCAFDVSDQALAPWMIKLLYNLYALTNQTIVAVSDGLKSELARAVRVGKSSINFIPNAVVNHQVRQLANTNTEAFDEAYYFVAVGRLVEQKGFDLLLTAYAEALVKQPGLPRLVIVGTGEDEQALKNQAHALGLDGKVCFYGYSENAYYIIQHAEAFILSSRHEGMPTVLVEAMFLDTPVIAFDCPTGPAELITHQQNGFLLPPQDIGALAQAMCDYRILQARRISHTVSRFEHQQVALAYMSHF